MAINLPTSILSPISIPAGGYFTNAMPASDPGDWVGLDTAPGTAYILHIDQGGIGQNPAITGLFNGAGNGVPGTSGDEGADLGAMLRFTASDSRMFAAITEANGAAQTYDAVLLVDNFANRTVSNSGVADSVTGTTAADFIAGGLGDDLLLGGNGNDALLGGAGADNLQGQNNDDYLYGGLGNDALIGGAGTDRLFGGADNDVLDGGAGDDVLQGGDGNDTLRGSDGADLMYGGPGTDLVNYSTSSSGLNVDLTSGIGYAGTAAGDLYGDIENIIGSAFQDSLTGDAGNNNIQGGGGPDSISGEAGDDVLNGGASSDLLFGGLGRDQFGFSSAAEADGDSIADFTKADKDLIHLSAIDANINSPGDQKFSFIDTNPFTGVAGQLRYESNIWGSTYVEGDLNGDALAEFAITLVGFTGALAATDFAL